MILISLEIKEYEVAVHLNPHLICILQVFGVLRERNFTYILDDSIFCVFIIIHTFINLISVLCRPLLCGFRSKIDVHY